MKQKLTWTLVGAGSVFALIFLGHLAQSFWFAETNNSVPNTDNTQARNSTAREPITNPVSQTGKPDINRDYVPPAPPKNENEKLKKNESLTPPGWKIFNNKNQRYKLFYPDTGQIVQMHTSGKEEDIDPTDGSCVSIKLRGGYITIWGKINNPELLTTCLRSGVGADWAPTSNLPVELFGKKYTAEGMETSSASAGYLKEFYHVAVTTGEQIEFGIEINEKYAPELTYTEAKEEIFKTLKTITHNK